MQDEETQILNIDITLDEPKKFNGLNSEIPAQNQVHIEHLGLQCCKYIKKKLEEFPKMKILALVFKKFLSLKNLNKPFSGGLSSYSLIQMILALLRQEEMQLNYLKKLEGMNMSGAQLNQNRLSVGMIFKHFIYEFGFQFEPQEKGIDGDGQFISRENLSYIFHQQTCNINTKSNQSVQTQKIFEQQCTCGLINQDKQDLKTKRQKNGEQGKDLFELLQQLLINQTGESENEEAEQIKHKQRLGLNQAQVVIVDPLNKFNNIGKSSYNFYMIQEELRQVYYRLNEELIKFVKYVGREQTQPNDFFKRTSNIDLYDEQTQKAKDSQDERTNSKSVQKNSNLKSQNNNLINEADMIDGLIPRILQIDYKIIQNEPLTNLIQQPFLKSEFQSSIIQEQANSDPASGITKPKTDDISKPIQEKKQNKNQKAQAANKQPSSSKPQQIQKQQKKKGKQ